jgi:hypothetical protein
VLNDIEESPTGGELFVADRTLVNPGIRIFDVTTNTQLTGSPISTGLPPFDIVFSTPVQTGIGDTPPPSRASLGQNYPNPFNPVTMIPFSLRRDGHLTLAIYDSRGALVRTLIDGHRAAGPAQMQWNGLSDAGRPVPSGIYFARLLAAREILTRKIVLLK